MTLRDAMALCMATFFIGALIGVLAGAVAYHEHVRARKHQ